MRNSGESQALRLLLQLELLERDPLQPSVKSCHRWKARAVTRIRNR